MVDTIDGNTEADAAQAASPGRVQASDYSACCEPGGSIAGIAMANGINANQVHRWMRKRGIEPPMRYFPMRSTIEPAAGMASSLHFGTDYARRAGIASYPNRDSPREGSGQDQFAKRRGNRMKVLVHDGHGIWLANRRLNQGRFRWRVGAGAVELNRAQFDTLILNMAWEQLAIGGVIQIL